MKNIVKDFTERSEIHGNVRASKACDLIWRILLPRFFFITGMRKDMHTQENVILNAAIVKCLRKLLASRLQWISSLPIRAKS